MSHYTVHDGVRIIKNDITHFVWHRDKEDRVIRVLSGIDWYLQIEAEVPRKMTKYKNMLIKKEVWHRIFCTSEDPDNDLVIVIKELIKE
jgi:hypothetical protein